MKKILIIGTVIIMVLAMTGCAKGNLGNEGIIDNNHTLEEKVERRYIYGRVKAIAGNEIEFQLAKDPGIDIEGIDKEQGQDAEKDNGKTEASTTTGAVASGDANKVSVGEIDKNQPLIDLEFTEEEKSIVIPTGVDINILSAAKGEGLKAIKEGTYLRILVDDNTAENPNILSVDVIS